MLPCASENDRNNINKIVLLVNFSRIGIAQAQAQVQTQQFLFHRENGPDAGISTSASISTKIKIFPFSYACAATSENEILLRHNTGIRIFTTRGYVWPMKTLDPDDCSPKQFSKMTKGSDDFACACVCVEFRFHLNQPYCMRLCLRLCLRR